MPRLLALLALLSVAAPAGAHAQDVMVVVVDSGETTVNQARLIRAIERATRRDVVRMTDERAPQARGRLSIAYERPSRWVLRYEAGGQVAWVADRITNPRELRERLVALSVSVVTVIDGAPNAIQPPPQPEPAQRAERRRGSWDDDIILALRDELVDPFAEDAPTGRERPYALLWSEVVDPFATPGSRRQGRQVWSEVIDPWATEVRRRR